MMPDTLTLTVFVDGAYASMNAIDRMDRRKSPAYLDLFRSVREAARLEVERIGWTPAEHFVQAQVVRYVTNLRGFNADAGNIGKCELDALAPSTPAQEQRDRCAPFAGVWTNDRLARPWSADIEFDPAGPDRVVILLRRRFPSPTETKERARPRASRVVAAAEAIVAKPMYVPGQPIPDGYALLGAELVLRDEALAKVRQSFDVAERSKRPKR
jgi:hypothetical protein